MIKKIADNLFNSFKVMNAKEKRWLTFLVIVSIINGCIQTIGVVSIMPFIALISDPSMSSNNVFFNYLKSYLEISDYPQLLIITATFSFLAILLSNMFIVLNYALNIYFFNNRGAKLSKKLLQIFLKKPTTLFNQYSQSDLTKMIFSDIDRALVGSQIAFLSIITDIIIFSVILTILILVNPEATFFTILGLSTGFLLIYYLLSRKINKLGKNFDKHEKSIYSNLKQALSLHKEIKLSNKQEYFVDKFSTPVKALYKNSSRYHILQFIPIQVIELLVFSIILLLAGYLTITTNSPSQTISSITLYAFASYRLIPVFKSIFESIEELIYSAPTLTTLMNEFSYTPIEHNLTRKLNTVESITFNDVSFGYDLSKFEIINSINIEFKKGLLTCISGPSGAGKSTCLDLILGLITPTRGNILIDHTPLKEEHVASWQNKIGYVPQRINLLDDTIANNIAFGVKNGDVDINRVIEVAKIANIHDKISSLKNGYHSKIGDGLLRISGGEQQRIAIARALYQKPDWLILDEATNELDQATEFNILNTLKEMQLSIIFVSHKSSIISMADSIIKIDDGKWNQVI